MTGRLINGNEFRKKQSLIGEKETSFRTIINTSRKATARLRVSNRFFSAFLISPEGYALTCAHPIKELGSEEFKNMTALLAEDDKLNEYVVRLVNLRSDLNMALIRIEADHELPYIRIADDKRNLRVGEACAIISDSMEEKYGAELCRIVSKDKSAMQGAIGTVCYLDSTMTNSILSGAPVIATEDGLVLGMIEGAIRKGENTATVMKPIHYFWKEFLD